MLSAMLQTPTSWGPTRFLRWETSTRPEAAQANAFYERVFPERHVGQPFVWPAPLDAADITPERYMAFRPRRLMTDQAWLSVEPAFSTQSGRWFARLHELAGERADVPQLLRRLLRLEAQLAPRRRPHGGLLAPPPATLWKLAP